MARPEGRQWTRIELPEQSEAEVLKVIAAGNAKKNAKALAYDAEVEKDLHELAKIERHRGQFDHVRSKDGSAKKATAKRHS